MCFNPQDAANSFAAFNKFTAPAMRFALKAKTILPTEIHNSELAAVLDKDAGIDGLLIDADDWAHFYGSRIQFGHNYGTFTIRRSRPSCNRTEFEKLLHARRTQGAMPSYTIQTYVDADGQGATVAIAQTVKLLQYITKHFNQWRRTDDGETFYYIPVDAPEVAAQVYRVDADGHVVEIKK